MNTCWFCGTEAPAGVRISRDMICAKCKQSLKCCKNCSFYDPAAHNQCRDPAAEWVRDKELANFCEFFQFSERTNASRASTKEDPRGKFDSLFKKK